MDRTVVARQYPNYLKIAEVKIADLKKEVWYLNID